MSGSPAGEPDSKTLLERLDDEGIHTVRVLFADQHGLLRGKAVSVDALPAAFERGIGVPGSLLHKDTANTYAIGLWAATGDETLDELVGARNVLMKPDPATYRSLPWSPGTGALLSDVETTAGRPIPHSTRQLAANALARLGDHGFAFKAGLELEFHLFRVAEDGQLSHSHPGWDLLGDDTLDRLDRLHGTDPGRLGGDGSWPGQRGGRARSESGGDDLLPHHGSCGLLKTRFWCGWRSSSSLGRAAYRPVS